MSIYGLPKFNQYCLDEFIDVQLAIQHIRFCPLSHRLELCNNINKRLREFGQSVRCPNEFKSYIDKEYVSSYYESDEKLLNLAKQVEEYANRLKIRLTIYPTFCVKKLSTFDYEHHCNNIRTLVVNPDLDKRLEQLKSHDELTSFTESLYQFTVAFINTCNSIKLLLCEKGIQPIDSSIANDVINSYKNITQHRSERREALLMYMNRVIKSLNNLDITVTANMLLAITIEWQFRGDSLLYHTFLSSDRNDVFNNTLDDWNDSEVLFNDTEAFLNKSIKNTYAGMTTRPDYALVPILKPFNKYMFDKRLYKYEPLFYRLQEEDIKKYNNSFSFKLSKVQLMMIQSSNSFDEVFVWTLSSDICYIGRRRNDFYLIGSEMSKQFIAINLDDLSKMINRHHNPEYTLPIKRLDFDKSVLVIESFTVDKEVDSITEGIDISANGDVTFSFSPKKTFMDQYAENHRLLVENSKVGNYEAMKTNLAFLFAMISIIERDYIYSKKKIKDSKLADAKKARTFAYNDFNTYLKQVQQHERGFDFTKYYQEQGYDTLTFTVSNDNIQGIRKLFNQICFNLL